MIYQEILNLAKEMELLPTHDIVAFVEMKRANNVLYYYVKLKDIEVIEDFVQDDEGLCSVETSTFENEETVRLSVTNGFLFVESNNPILLGLNDSNADFTMFKTKRIA